MARTLTKEDLYMKIKERVAKLGILSHAAELIVTGYAIARGDNEPTGPDEILARACYAPGSMAELYEYELRTQGQLSDAWRGKLGEAAQRLWNMIIDRNALKVPDRDDACSTMPGLGAIAWEIQDEAKEIEELVGRYAWMSSQEQ